MNFLGHVVIVSMLAQPVFAGALNSACKLDVSSSDNSEVFLTGREIENLTRGDIIDAPISTYSADGMNLWILPTAMQRNANVYLSHTLIRGDMTEPDQKLVGIYNQHKLFEISDKAVSGTKGYKWITNTYQTEDGILAFIHSEYTAKNDHWGMPCTVREDGNICAPGKSRIGLAWMDLSNPENHINPRFIFLGHIAGSSADRAHINVHGTPYYITSEHGVDYLNILFRDANESIGFGGISRARSPLKEVLSAAKSGRTSDWKKYNEGNWEDALSGNSSPVIDKVPSLAGIDKNISDGRVYAHGDIVKHKESGAYYFVAYTLKSDEYGTPSRLVFYDSCDGIRWRFNRFANDRDDGDWGWSYLSIIDDDGRDNGEASGSFNIIAGFDYGRPKKHVVKLTVSVPDTCSCSEDNQ